MSSDHQKLYTAGSFAKKAGVTLRTIRFYDKKGLLKPSEYSAAGYRLYSELDFVRLQKILTLKYLGFTLHEIKNAINHDFSKPDIEKSLQLQKQVLQTRIQHMTHIIEAITEAEGMLVKGDMMDWSRFVNIIQVVNKEKILMDQYKNAANLKARINLHDRYSTNKYGWHRWLFDEIKLFPGARVLELGCGDGTLWAKNIDRLPEGCSITLTDASKGMIEDAKRNLGQYAHQFSFEVVDALQIPFTDGNFDVVMANHLLFYLPDRNRGLAEMKRVLKPGGVFYTSTTGKEHMKELNDTIMEFEPRITLLHARPADAFGLENGWEQLGCHFSNIQRFRYEDSLRVNKVEPLIEFILSMCGNVREVLNGERLEEMKQLLQGRISSMGSITITKDSGLFAAIK